MRFQHDIQQVAFDNACARADEIDERFFREIDNRTTVGLTVNR